MVWGKRVLEGLALGGGLSIRWIGWYQICKGMLLSFYYLAQTLHQLELFAEICSLAPWSHPGCPGSRPPYFCNDLLPQFFSLEQMASCMNFSRGKGMNTVFQPQMLCQFMLLSKIHTVRRNLSVSIWPNCPARSQISICVWRRKATKLH